MLCATEVDRLTMDIAMPILSTVPYDKAAFHKGLSTLDKMLAALEAHLRGRTFLVHPQLLSNMLSTPCWRSAAHPLTKCDSVHATTNPV